MPRIKQPDTLSCLALNASARLIITSAENVDKASSDEAVLTCPHEPFVAFCLSCRKIDIIQRVFNESLGYLMRDLLYDEVATLLIEKPELYGTRIRDHRITYSILINENLTELEPHRFKGLPSTSGRNVFSMRDDPFWREQIPKLYNIVVLNLTFPSSCYEISTLFILVGWYCRKLMQIRFETEFLLQTIGLLAGCKELRLIKYAIVRCKDNVDGESEDEAFKLALVLFPKLEYYKGLKRMGAALASLDSKRPLNLRMIQDMNCTADIINNVIALCPQLTRLDLGFHDVATCSDVFLILTSSSLEILKLKLYFAVCYENVKSFFVCKGYHLQTIKLDFKNIPYWLMQLIARTCKNLTKLVVLINQPSSEIVPSDAFTLPEQDSTLTKLNTLVFYHFSNLPLELYQPFFKALLPLKSKLSAFFFCTSGIINIDEELIKLLDSSRIANITEFFLLVKNMSVRLLTSFFEKCPKLITIEIDNLMEKCASADVKEWINHTRQEVKEKNLNFEIFSMDMD